ncbi:hypothetical protein CL645_04340 [bacterium]|nr:hypothetical protein [bacterium]|tara:strand:+ start:11180 stop:13519 length:2340 start_codon:yes stop_codon:yes gene_type:complete
MVKKYLIYTLLLFSSFTWINNLGKQKTKSLFESTGEPRRIYESKITIWDQERQVAKIITNNLEETKENLWLIKDITEAIFYRNYEPYVEVDSKSAKYNDLMETLEFEGPFSAKTNDGITAKTMRALWTKKSQLLFFPDSVNLKNEDIDITGEDVLFETNEDNVLLIGRWHAKLLKSPEDPHVEGGLAVYNTQNGIITAQSKNWDEDQRPQALITANREPVFKSLGIPQLSPPGKPTLKIKNWDVSAEILQAKSKDYVAYLSENVKIEEKTSDKPRKIMADSVEYYWNPGYFNFEKNIVFEEDDKTLKAESGFFNKNNEYLKLNGPASMQMQKNFFDTGKLPLLNINGLLEVTQDPKKYLLQGGFSWSEGEVFIGGENGEWDPGLEQLKINGFAEYKNNDFETLSQAARVNPELVKFLGSSQLKYKEVFEGEVQNLNYQKELNLIRSGPLKGYIDDNKIIALSLSTETDKNIFDITEARISLNKDLEIESKTLQLNTLKKTGFSPLDTKIFVNDLKLNGDKINFQWDPVGLDCSQSCIMENPTWIGEMQKIIINADNEYLINELEMTSKEGWLGVMENIIITTDKVFSDDHFWEMNKPEIKHPEWTIKGEIGNMKEDSSQISILGNVSIKNELEKRRAYGEKWQWLEVENMSTLEGYPRIEGEKDKLFASKLIKKNDFWEALGPISWEYNSNTKTTISSEAAAEEDGGYKFEGNVVMKHQDVNVRADYAKVRTNAENIIFYDGVTVQYKDGNVLKGDRFVWDLIAEKGTIEKAKGNIAID